MTLNQKPKTEVEAQGPKSKESCPHKIVILRAEWRGSWEDGSKSENQSNNEVCAGCLFEQKLDYGILALLESDDNR